MILRLATVSICDWETIEGRISYLLQMHAQSGSDEIHVVRSGKMVDLPGAGTGMAVHRQRQIVDSGFEARYSEHM